MSTPDAASKVTTFRGSGVAADICLLVILLPLGAAALAFLFMIPATLVAAVLGLQLQSAALVGVVLSAVAVILLIVRLRLFWSITLDRDVLLVGKWWPLRVPYERIRYLSSGAAADPMAEVKRNPAKPVPLVFATGMFAQRRLFLLRDDSERCLRALYARCPNAGAIDADGNVFLPRNPLALRFAQIRLAETLAIRGVTAISTAVAAVLVRLMLFRDIGSLHDVAYSLRAFSVWWMIYPLIPALLAYGWRCLHQIGRVMRGEQDQAG